MIIRHQLKLTLTMSDTLQERLNFYVEFKEWYLKIVKDFQFDYQKDRESRNYFLQLLAQKGKEWNLETLLKKFNGLIQEHCKIVIYGSGPSLEPTVNLMVRDLRAEIFSNFLNLAADGASVLLTKRKVPIDAIFTDLDGITKKEFLIPKFVVVHAHGDNIDKLKYFKEEIITFPNLIGTTQVEPVREIINPGGFTDGDRILFFLRPFLTTSHKLFLIGMDFKGIVGKYSKPNFTEHQKASPIKLKKLEYAVKLIEWIKESMSCDVFFVGSESPSKKFKTMPFEEFKDLLNR